MSWRDSILEMPCVAEGDEFCITLGPGSDQMLTFSSLGKRYMLGFQTSDPIGEVQICERLDGAWKPIGQFEPVVLKNRGDEGPITFCVAFHGKKIILRQDKRIVLEAQVDQCTSMFVNVAGTSSAGVRLLGAKSIRVETNLKLPNAELTLIPMVHYSRSGSTVVGQLLPRDRIVKVTELYSPGSFIGPRIAGTVWERARDAWRFSPTKIEAFVSKMVSANRMWLLHEPRLFFEIKLNLFTSGVFNFDAHRYFGYLQRIGVEKLVFLHRRNLLRRLISARISLESGNWHNFKGTTVTRSNPVHIDTNCVRDPDFGSNPLPLRVLLDRSFAEIERFRHLLKANFQVLELWYEDHVEHDPNVGAGAITELYRVPYTAQPAPLVRQNPGTLTSLIANFDDVRRALIETPHEWMLADKSPT